jgi:hypothetical protein
VCGLDGWDGYTPLVGLNIYHFGACSYHGGRLLGFFLPSFYFSFHITHSQRGPVGGDVCFWGVGFLCFVFFSHITTHSSFPFSPFYFNKLKSWTAS